MESAGDTRQHRLLKHLNKLSIYRRLTVSFILAFVLPILLIGGFYALYSFRNNLEETELFLEQSSEQIVDNIVYYVFYNIDLLEEVAANPEITEGLAAYGHADWDVKRATENNIRLVMQNTFGVNEAVKAAEIVAEGRSYFYYRAPISNGDFTTSRILSEEDKAVSVTIGKKEVLSDRKSYLILRKGIFDAQGVLLGNLVAAIDLTYLNEACYNNVTDLRNDVYIVNARGTIVSASNDDDIGSIITEQVDDSVQVAKVIPGTELQIINKIELGRFRRFSLIQLILTLIVAVIFAAVANGSAALLTKSITRPITRLMEEMNKEAVEKHIVDTGQDEYHQVIEGFNDMNDRIVQALQDRYEMQLKESELKEMKKEAELSSLQQQINPHFLYNTLEAIYWSCQMEGDETISEIVNALGSYLRAIIDNGRASVTLMEEIESVNNYIYLQNRRFGDRIHLSWSVPADIRTTNINKLAIHPVVEDVIATNLDEVESVIDLMIAIERRGETVSVVLGGQSVNYYLSVASDKAGEAKGISSVDERLVLHHGKDFGAHLDPGSSIITITMPVLADEGEGGEVDA